MSATPEEDRPRTEEELAASMRKAWMSPSWRYPNLSDDSSLAPDHLSQWLDLIHRALHHVVVLLALATVQLSLIIVILGLKL
jgi:hypothetical protein